MYKYLILIFLVNKLCFVCSKSIQEDLTSDTCSIPNLAINGTKSINGEEILSKDFSQVREVKFSGSIGPLGEKRICKIKCIGGQWVGPLCMEQQDNGRFQPLFRNCKLEYNNKNLIVTFRNITVNSGSWVYPHGSTLKVRCRELGLYKLLGNPLPKCENGAWTSRLPTCVATTMLTNYTDDAPPTILIRIPSGSASVEPGGELAVYPGSTVHLECLFSRRMGSPDWTWTSPLGQYLAGWAIAPEEREFKYRLSIYYAKLQDTGKFTCATPKGITNSISVHVSAVHCDSITISGTHINVRIEGTKLGHKAYFQCPVGHKVAGDQNITCQLSGKWSAPIPKCEPVTCPLFETLEDLGFLHLSIEEQNNSYGGRIVFTCAWGYSMVGHPGLECEINGSWSGSPPKCNPIQCSPISINKENIIQIEVPGMDGEKFAVGSMFQFSCKENFTLHGERTIICTETGVWSHPAPFCKPLD